MRRIGIVSVLLLTAVLAGCSTPPPANDDGTSPDVTSVYVPLNDGRTVICVLYDGGSYATGMSCDWANAK